MSSEFGPFSISKQEQPFNGMTRELKIDDLEAIRPILQVWIKDRNTALPLPNEVESVINAMTDSIQGKNNNHYIVAEEAKKICGVVGFRVPVGEMLLFVTTKKAIELINAYVDPSQRRGKRVGRALLVGLEKVAKSEGSTEIILNSGPRYKNTAWGFYTKMYGEPVAKIENMYGKGGDALVWRKIIA